MVKHWPISVLCFSSLEFDMMWFVHLTSWIYECDHLKALFFVDDPSFQDWLPASRKHLRSGHIFIKHLWLSQTWVLQCEESQFIQPFLFCSPKIKDPFSCKPGERYLSQWAKVISSHHYLKKKLTIMWNCICELLMEPNKKICSPLLPAAMINN